MSGIEASAVDYLKTHPDFVKEWVSNNVDGAELIQWAKLQDETQSKVLPLKQTTDTSTRKTELQSVLKNDLSDYLKRKRKSSATHRKNKNLLLSLSDKELLLELIRDVSSELDVDVLCHKILVNVSILTRGDRASLFLAKGSKENRYLVSRLFDVTADSTFAESLVPEERQIKVPFGTGIAGHVAKTKETINISDAYQDDRFNRDVDRKTGYKTGSILCMPILNYEGELLGVAQIMNKDPPLKCFTADDEEVFKTYLSFGGIGLSNAQLFEMSVQEYNRNQLLLTLAHNIFEESTSLDGLVQKIMLDAQDVLQCDRCSVFLVDEDTDGDVVFSKAFELHSEQKGNIINHGTAELRTSQTGKIAREVALSGQVLNVDNPDQKLTNLDGSPITSLLCAPIRNPEKQVIGVVQLVNKLNAKHFTESDIILLEAFAIFCGLGIHNCQLYEGVCKLMAKQKVALECLSYHASAPQEETEKITSALIPNGKELGLYKYDFDDLILTEDDTIKATIRMFLDSGITTKFQIPYETLCRWTCSVKKNYRPVTYHNWRHAFNVAQTMFAMVYTGEMKTFMDDLDVFGLLVACLCHDLDHRGTNNAFQLKSESPLAQLYSTSTMEHHHFDQCIMIIQSEGNNILMNIPTPEYKQVIKIIESAIISTDLALYFKKKGSFQELVDNGEKNWGHQEKKDLLMGMMMTACDVSAITKPWSIQKRVAHLVAAEFFEQGDLERSRLNVEPMAMMDRQKKNELPTMQIGFIDAICMPVYKMLSRVELRLHPLQKGCENNRDKWNALVGHYEWRPVDLNASTYNVLVTSNAKTGCQADEPTKFEGIVTTIASTGNITNKEQMGSYEGKTKKEEHFNGKISRKAETRRKKQGGESKTCIIV